jgi:hypothetical protein
MTAAKLPVVAFVWTKHKHRATNSAIMARIAPVPFGKGDNSQMSDDNPVAERERRAARKRADRIELTLRQVRTIIAASGLPEQHQTLVLVLALREDNQASRAKLRL